MNQNNYEKYAVVKQQELLHKERNLQQAISCLRDKRKFASLQSIDSAIDFIADLYDLSIDEVKRAMDGEEYFHSVYLSSKHNALPPDTDEQLPRHHGSMHD